MKAIASLSLLIFLRAVRAHGGHEHGGPAAGETIQQYAQRHMSSEHHIDSFDVRSFHQLHDLNRFVTNFSDLRNVFKPLDSDGYWDRAEIEAIYGVHHVYSTKKSKDEVEHKNKADHIVNTVLAGLDLDHDGRVSPEELEKVGLDGLPNFEGMGAEGHHYDVESEFFLHHEEQFHSTPETQTDEAYNHPEDLEHFAQHEAIERAEAEKEAKFQGITVEEVLQAQGDHDSPPPPPPAGDAASPPTDEGQAPIHQELPPEPVTPHPHDEQVVPAKPFSEPPVPRVTRITPPEKQEPRIKFKDAPMEGKKKGEWGTGDAGYKPPTEPSDKMRKNLPYKNRMQYKFRRNWGDF